VVICLYHYMAMGDQYGFPSQNGTHRHAGRQVQLIQPASHDLGRPRVTMGGYFDGFSGAAA